VLHVLGERAEGALGWSWEGRRSGVGRVKREETKEGGDGDKGACAAYTGGAAKYARNRCGREGRDVRFGEGNEQGKKGRERGREDGDGTNQWTRIGGPRGEEEEVEGKVRLVSSTSFMNLNSPTNEKTPLARLETPKLETRRL